MSNYPKHQLSKEDGEELQKAAFLFQSDQKTRQVAQQYMLEYRHAISSSTNQRSSVVAKCALFFAQKSQYLYDMKGQRIQGIGLSLNQIIKTYPDIDEFVFILKDFIRKVRLPDPQVESDLHNVIEKLNFSQTFYNKFEKILRDLNFVDKVSESYGYLKIFSSFIWLLFIDARTQIQRNSRDIVKSTCLLTTVFYSLIRYCLDYTKPTFLLDVNEKINGNKQSIAKIIARITEKLFSLFSIQDYETYKLSVCDFDDYFQTLLQTNVLKSTSDKIDFFSPQLININYKRLDAMYQKRLNANDLDERFFLKDRITTLTPSKMTPFERQRIQTKGMKVFKNEKIENANPNIAVTKNFYSHRVLDYQPEKQLIEIKNSNLQVKELKFPGNIMFSPSMTKISLISATPVTLGMEMYNYIIQKPKMTRESRLSKRYEAFVTLWVEQFPQMKRTPSDSIQQRKTKEMRSNIVISLYTIAIESYLTQFSNQQNVEDICRCFLALSTQTVCFVCNMVGINFQFITESLNPNTITLYKTNEFFYRFDKLMPGQLRTHFVDIQTKLISCQLWKKQLPIQLISSVCSNDTSANEIGQRLLKKMLQHIAQQLTKLSIPFKIPQQLLEQIFSITKCLLSFQTQVLYNRHIDQLIICSLYAICKNHKVDIKFNDIKSKYEELNQNNKNDHSEIMCNVYASQTSKVDIIKFYNGVFISYAKPYVKEVPKQCFDELHPLLKLKLQQVPPKDAFHILRRHKVKGVFQEQTSSKYLNTKKVLDYQDEKKNSRLNKIEQGEEDEQRSLKKDRKLLRLGKSSTSISGNTIKTEVYCSTKGLDSHLVNL